MNTLPEQTTLTIPLTSIVVRDDHNPRKFFNDAQQRELTRSMAGSGILQPIIVRPIKEGNSEGFWLIAGERRLRAAQELKWSEIPAVVRDVSDDDAVLLATIENTMRSDMSPAEEAQAARRILQSAGNDRAEARRLLGWGEAKFNARLGLLHASRAVLDALTEGRIKLGHAELLSQLPVKTQDGTLPKIIEKGMGVQDLRSAIQTFALALASAPFDTAGCNGCPHNSSFQRTLFDDHLERDAQCANRECYTAKAKESVEAKRNELEERFNVVFTDAEREPNSYAVIMVNGAKGVGETQFNEGCKGCRDYGALIDTKPGKEGRVMGDVCFNLACLKGKQEDYRKHMEGVSGKTDTQKKPVQGGKEAKANQQQPTPATDEKSKPAGKAAKGESNALPKCVTEKLHSTVRWMARNVVLNVDSKRIGMVLAVHELLKSANYSQEVMPKGLGKLFPPTHDRADALPVLYGLTDDQLSDLCRNATAYLLEKQPGHAYNGTGVSEMSKFASKVFAVTKRNPSDYFTLDREFLAPYTKAGIEAILREAVNGNGEGFVEWYESQPNKKLSALLTKKKDEILNEIFADGGFDFKGYLPSCISKFMGNN
ncbi:MAG: PRTRC system ParB family protein [Candidatus Methylumidiphilus sp.]